MERPAPGKAVELPSGVYNVVAQLRYSLPSLQWHVWGLDDEGGHTATLGQVGEDYGEVQRESVAALPEEDELEGLRLRHRGEARAERWREGRTDFWLAQARHYADGTQHVIYTDDKDGVHRVVVRVMDEKLVRAY